MIRERWQHCASYDRVLPLLESQKELLLPFGLRKISTAGGLEQRSGMRKASLSCAPCGIARVGQAGWGRVNRILQHNGLESHTKLMHERPTS